MSWSYDVADSKLDFLAGGDVLTLTYMATVNDGHGGSASQPLTVTITGTNDVPTIATTSGSITELPGTSNAAIDHATGTVSFTDADLTARPVVSAQFTSFTYQNAAHTDVTESLTSQQKADVAAVEAALVLTPASTNANDGAVGWSYDVADSKLDFLAAGETLTLTYTATVSEGPSASVTEPITVTITGTNDAPTIATTNGSIVELPGTGNETIDHATGHDRLCRPGPDGPPGGEHAVHLVHLSERRRPECHPDITATGGCRSARGLAGADAVIHKRQRWRGELVV